MARICPITGSKVIYLECQECDEKICRCPNSSKTLSKIAFVCNVPELKALYLTQNCFGRLHGEIAGAHILHNQEGKWHPEFPSNPTQQQKVILEEAVAVVNTVIETCDLKDLGFRKAREEYFKAERGIYKFAFYDDCFYVVIFDRKVVEEWYQKHIDAILQQTKALVTKGIITYPENEWVKARDTEIHYHIEIHVGDMVYPGNIHYGGTGCLAAQVACQLVNRYMDPYIADFLKEHGVYV